MNNIIEINKNTVKAGRVPIKLVLHKIHTIPTEVNGNGIHWDRTYCENNKESVKGMPIVCQFADGNNEIPFGAHGEMTHGSDGKIIFEDSLVVGSFEDSYISDGIELNGEKISGLVGSGWIYEQRFPCLVDYLQKQYDSNTPVESSVEICADKSKGNTKIIYDGIRKDDFRIPKEFQYSGQALCIGVEAADNSAVMIELNSAKRIKNKEENKKMDDKIILELNQNIESKTNEIASLTLKNSDLETKNTELNTLITDANKTVEELNTKVSDLETELNACKEELNKFKAEKEEAEMEAKKAEVNTYFETEIPKNGFDETEVNSLKHFVDEIDIIGLKSAESELCAKKFKEMKAKDIKDEAEINSKIISFIPIHEKEKKVIPNKTSSFFE